jgi:hypothetical protein
LLLATDDKSRTVWQVAVKDGKLGVLQKIWELAEGIITETEIKCKLLLDDKGRTIWHVAAEQDKINLLQKKWDWAKRCLTREEMLQWGVVNQNEYE